MRSLKFLRQRHIYIDGAEFPPEFIKFMTSATIWGMHCKRADRPYLPEHVANIDRVKWPVEFENHIFTKTEEFKRTLDTLLIKCRAR